MNHKQIKEQLTHKDFFFYIDTEDKVQKIKTTKDYKVESIPMYTTKIKTTDKDINYLAGIKIIKRNERVNRTD